MEFHRKFSMEFHGVISHGRVGCQHKAETSPTKIIKEVLHYNKDSQSKAMKDGLENEQLVIDKYTELMHQQGHTRVHVAKCGFFVEKEKGILGASPDGLVTDPSHRSPHGIIEAKNVTVKGTVSRYLATL